MGYVQYPQIKAPKHTQSAKEAIHKVYVSTQSVRAQLTTQSKQINQTNEPKLPKIKWNKGSIELNGKVHKLPITKEYILKEYADVFQGIGTLPGGPYHIRLKEDYRPVQHPPRSVPIAMQPAYKRELE